MFKLLMKSSLQRELTSKISIEVVTKCQIVKCFWRPRSVCEKHVSKNSVRSVASLLRRILDFRHFEWTLTQRVLGQLVVPFLSELSKQEENL